jgi:hypothetical protein
MIDDMMKNLRTLLERPRTQMIDLALPRIAVLTNR